MISFILRFSAYSFSCCLLIFKFLMSLFCCLASCHCFSQSLQLSLCLLPTPSLGPSLGSLLLFQSQQTCFWLKAAALISPREPANSHVDDFSVIQFSGPISPQWNFLFILCNFISLTYLVIFLEFLNVQNYLHHPWHLLLILLALHRHLSSRRELGVLCFVFFNLFFILSWSLQRSFSET